MAPRKPLAQAAADSIMNYIRENDLKPGDKIPTEPELASLLKVGRGTVREAVGSLVSRNILDVRQGSGTFISDKQGVVEDPLGLNLYSDDLQTALEIMEVRLMIEPQIAFRAALEASDEQIAALEEQCALIEKQIRNGKPYRKEDARFHQMIGECCRNTIIARLIPVITSSVIRNVDATRDRYRRQTLIHHRQVMNAIAAHDPYTAQYTMTTHLSILHSGILEAIQAQKQN